MKSNIDSYGDDMEFPLEDDYDDDDTPEADLFSDNRFMDEFTDDYPD